MTDIRLVDVKKEWDEAVALHGIDFAVGAGEFVALLGPSGCGKSTTLRLIAGLDHPSAGRILIGGRDVTDLAPSKRGIAMVFQSYALFPHLSVAENIIFGLRVRKVGTADREARLARAADMLGLGALLDRKPSQLSGGQQQRVALARAIVAEAGVCLMDEPLSNLDAQLRLEMRREIRALQQRLGMTMVYVTHDQSEAMTMADRIILMRSGQIEQNGTPAELYETPATSFAARFIGSPPMNVIAAGSLADVSWIRLPGEADGLACGIRAEAVRIDAEGVPAEVIAAEYLGADTLIETRIGQDPVVVRVAGRRDAKPGERLGLAWSPEAAHWFEQEGGRRL
ncbi:ABC transporter ATP-binding protein [Enterovirga rhinocerotis]|uniref:sn-glycerol 3-phosphate transport system ATP-binding protein n=1 Tax=Enterovirga rhinocerotis TaxID=1339210 RepID=A0A4R7C509_9HYPH|nr:ABC transporter ATP-binding protein [Enterovirga rhinocerotis]TDR93650.1 sn-glycerol 3-phosphate transport system ATP-binding protein [Enterovirga rhinocerotis]